MQNNWVQCVINNMHSIFFQLTGNCLKIIKFKFRLTKLSTQKKLVRTQHLFVNEFSRMGRIFLRSFFCGGSFVLHRYSFLAPLNAIYAFNRHRTNILRKPCEWIDEWKLSRFIGALEVWVGAQTPHCGPELSYNLNVCMYVCMYKRNLISSNLVANDIQPVWRISR